MRAKKWLLAAAAILIAVPIILVCIMKQCTTLPKSILDEIQFSYIGERVDVYEQAGFDVEYVADTVILNNRAENPTIEIQLYGKGQSSTPIKYHINISRNPLGNSLSSWLVLHAQIYQEDQGYIKLWLDCSSPWDGREKLESLLDDLFALQ